MQKGEINWNLFLVTKKDLESVKKKYHDASEKVAEKYRQYQKLQVSIPAPLKLNTQSLQYSTN